MQKRITVLGGLMAVSAAPAMAASKNPFSADFWTLSNTDLIVSIGFLVFLGILAYFKVPGMMSKMLDERADGIRSELDEAKALRITLTELSGKALRERGDRAARWEMNRRKAKRAAKRAAKAQG